MFDRISRKTAGAWVARCDHQYFCRIDNAARPRLTSYLSILKRLPESLQDIPCELGNSSRKSTPLDARLISPGLSVLPPPQRATALAVWWTDLKGLSLTADIEFPTVLLRRSTSISSGSERGGSILEVPLPEVFSQSRETPPAIGYDVLPLLSRVPAWQRTAL